jgi:putative transposase
VIHIDAKTFESIPLNSHTRELLSSNTEVRVRSFTLSENSLSLCISKEVEEKETEKSLAGAIGIDRNLANLAVGDSRLVTIYDITKAVKIAENSRSIVGSFKRNDARVRHRIASKYGRRRKERVKQLLNIVSKRVVENAKTRNESIVFEDIRSIRGLYSRGNGQGKSLRAKMNSWPFYEIKRQIEYKAAWEGVPVFTLTKGETRGTTTDCPRCGERLQVPVRGDEKHYRQLWCTVCNRWRDRDLIAVLNISRR